MTKKLEEIFGFDQLEQAELIVQPEKLTSEETRTAIIEIDVTLDKIDAALPAIRNLDSSDTELDEIAELAKESFENLSDLGMNVDSRYSAELFAVASTMLGHALTAKTTKLNKKLKMIDLQLKKLKLDQDKLKANGNEPGENAPIEQGHVLDRNDLLKRIIGDRSQNTK
jgi:hypothetical protein